MDPHTVCAQQRVPRFSVGRRMYGSASSNHSFTNDLPSVLSQASVSVFADETTLGLTGKSISDVKTNLDQEDCNWIERSRLMLNAEKLRVL